MPAQKDMKKGLILPGTLKKLAGNIDGTAS